jgi:hypothetical protein
MLQVRKTECLTRTTLMALECYRFCYRFCVGG